jgi:hypothetical protein
MAHFTMAHFISPHTYCTSGIILDNNYPFSLIGTAVSSRVGYTRLSTNNQQNGNRLCYLEYGTGLPSVPTVLQYA